MYKLETENFALELEPYPANSRLRIKVSSYGYSADAVMDADKVYIAGFAVCLNELYEKLSGTARLEDFGTDFFSESFIEFTAKKNGYIGVSGCIDNRQDYNCRFFQQLTFENEFDQTYLRDFARALLADYGGDAE